jgi:hypothetical protein
MTSPVAGPYSRTYSTRARNRSPARPQTPLTTCRARPDLARACSLHPEGRHERARRQGNRRALRSLTSGQKFFPSGASAGIRHPESKSAETHSDVERICSSKLRYLGNLRKILNHQSKSYEHDKEDKSSHDCCRLERRNGRLILSVDLNATVLINDPRKGESANLS